MPTPPGGMILSGIGGRIYVNPLGSLDEESASFFDVANWQIVEHYLNAACTHTGTMGAITRRRVGYDFQFSASVPFDQENPPESLLCEDDTVAVRFNLGDPTLDPTLVWNNDNDVEQKYKFRPSAILDRVVTVLSGDGKDVIRQEVMGSGNALMFLLPDQSSWLNEYLAYLRSRNWTV